VKRSPREGLANVIERIEGARKAGALLDEYALEGRDVAVPLDAILYNLLVIGEAINAVPDDLKQTGTPLFEALTTLLKDARNLIQEEFELVGTAPEGPR
jgi:uncharacterized protein with HEPN domain